MSPGLVPAKRARPAPSGPGGEQGTGSSWLVSHLVCAAGRHEVRTRYEHAPSASRAPGWQETRSGCRLLWWPGARAPTAGSLGRGSPRALPRSTGSVGPRARHAPRPPRSKAAQPTDHGLRPRRSTHGAGVRTPPGPRPHTAREEGETASASSWPRRKARASAGRKAEL